MEVGGGRAGGGVAQRVGHYFCFAEEEAGERFIRREGSLLGQGEERNGEGCTGYLITGCGRL